MNLEQILRPTTSLPQLSAEAPEVWDEVFADVKSRVHTGAISSLAGLRQEHLNTLNRWRSSTNTPLGASQHARDTVLRSRMMVLAIDQFADAMTGKIGKKATLRDRLVFLSTIGKALAKGTLLSCEAFDRSWSWIKDPAWATGEIQRQGFWSVPTKEFVQRIKEHATGRPVLELGSGRGYLAKGLRDNGLVVNAVDDFSWQSQDQIKILTAVDSLDAIKALAKVKPQVVVCSWPPPGNSFEERIFATPSVQLYMAIVSTHHFASGNWNAYQKQNQFTCSTSVALNQLLRPLEAEQQVLLFRRR